MTTDGASAEDRHTGFVAAMHESGIHTHCSHRALDPAAVAARLAAVDAARFDLERLLEEDFRVGPTRAEAVAAADRYMRGEADRADLLRRLLDDQAAVDRVREGLAARIADRDSLPLQTPPPDPAG